jgi:hypothetical protein
MIPVDLKVILKNTYSFSNVFFPTYATQVSRLSSITDEFIELEEDVFVRILSSGVELLYNLLISGGSIITLNSISKSYLNEKKIHKIISL